MRTTLVILLALFLTLPAAAAPSPDNKGLDRACERAASSLPCSHLGVIPDTLVTNGTRSYSNGTYRAEGTVVVAPGGTVVVENATITFGPESGGFIVQPGGTLRVLGSAFSEGADPSEYGIDAQPGSTLALVDSSIDGGSGVRLATNDAEVHGNTLSRIPVALRNDGVTVRIHHNAFVNNTVAVNNTGGFPTLDNNTFDGGAVCVRDWLSDPTIVHNTFHRCHVGIYHHRSESKLSYNTMDDDMVPPGGGIVVEDTMSPTIEGNDISRFGAGIIIKNARAYIRNNSIHDNYGDGIRIENNSAPMDIQGNAVFDNGHIGIALFNVTNLPVVGNEVHGHANHTGIFVNVGVNVTVADNDVHDNRVGISIHNSPDLAVTDNRVNDSTFEGIWIGIASTGALLERNVVERAATGIWVDAAAATLVANEVVGATTAGIVLQGNGTTMLGDVARDGARGIGVVGAHGVYLDQVSALGNSVLGFWVDAGGSHTFRNTNASGNEGDGYAVYNNTANIALQGARALFNERGLHTFGGNTTTAYLSWWEGNSVAGVQNDDAGVTISSEYAYWGSATGPTHVDNPNGTGDLVVGNVDYTPYLSSPPGPYAPIAFVD